MTAPPIEPDATLGVLGGGQLGAMFAMAGRRLGYRIAVWDPDGDAPAHLVADTFFAAPFDDLGALTQFSQLVRAVTYEWENVPAAVCESLERSALVRPGARVLRLLQDRLDHKGFLSSHGFPVAPFRAVSSPEELTLAEEVGFPCICKTATAGYDGKGQWPMATCEELSRVQQRLRQIERPGLRWIVESFLRFERELSVLVVRGSDGECRVYPVVENVHEDGILRMSQVPAPVSASVAEKATTLARQVVTALEGVGVFCIEMFLMPDGALLINEVAPRPHNSGHYTLDACSVSQFEQQVRALCGLPLGEARLLTPAVMVNLIGDDVISARIGQGGLALFGTPGAVLHLYGKRTVRPGRKMGHVTFVADKVESARDQALRFRDTFLRKSPSPGGTRVSCVNASAGMSKKEGNTLLGTLVLIALCGSLAAGLLWGCVLNKPGPPMIPGDSAQPLQKQEAFFEFQTLPGDTFVFQLTDATRIKEARDILAKKHIVHVAGVIVKAPQPYNRPWNFHLDPRTVAFVVLTPPECDGAIRYIEDQLDHVGKNLLPNYRWCPSSSRLVRELSPSGAKP